MSLPIRTSARCGLPLMLLGVVLAAPSVASVPDETDRAITEAVSEHDMAVLRVLAAKHPFECTWAALAAEVEAKSGHGKPQAQVDAALVCVTLGGDILESAPDETLVLTRAALAVARDERVLVTERGRARAIALAARGIVRKAASRATRTPAQLRDIVRDVDWVLRETDDRTAPMPDGQPVPTSVDPSVRSVSGG